MNINSSDINDLSAFIKKYSEKLKELAKMEGIKYINHPEEILLCLDKYKCRERIKHLPCTPMFEVSFTSAESLFDYLDKHNLNQVFIKPRFGAGASGIIALKRNKKRNENIIYTTIIYKENQFKNGKKVIKIKKTQEIVKIINFILNIGAVVEKWLVKKKYQGLDYDVRVVVVRDRFIYIIPRGSKSPITNLHLNNLPLPFSVITNEKKIKEIALKVIEAFPKLNYIGIDILITPKDELFIIEVNGQGDGIYQDYYNENQIYKAELEILENL